MKTVDSLRRDWNHETMTSHGLDGVICRLPENVLLLTGYWPRSGTAFAVAPREGPIWLIVLETELDAIPDGAAGEIRAVPNARLETMQPHIRDAIVGLGLGHGTIGLELDFEAVAPAHGAAEVFVLGQSTQRILATAAPEATFVDAGAALNMARTCKTPHELELLRRASRVAAFGLEAFVQSYESGRTEVEVAAAVEAAIMTRGVVEEGARTARGWAHLMTGPRAAHAYSAHPDSSARTIEKGDLGVLELGVVVDGYWSDLTRTLVAGGQPDARQSEMWEAVVAAHDVAVREARPGMTGSQVDALARDQIERRGFGDLFVHHTGHGLGFRYHEPQPFLAPDSADVLREGMVSSIEPGLYVDGWGGMRLEDNVAFTADGVQVLSQFSSALSGS